MRALVRGGLGGLAATIPMTLAMASFHRLLPFVQRGPLPPREIMSNLVRAIGVHRQVPEEARRLSTWVAHFGYGAGAGAAYGALRPDGGVPSGVAFGLGLWATSYVGWLPAVGLAAPLTRRTPERIALMVAAHVVWGASLGLAVRALATARRPVRGRPHLRLVRRAQPQRVAAP